MYSARLLRSVLLILSLFCSLWLACSGENQAPRDAAPESAVDRGAIEGPITQPVVDAFVPLDGRADTAASPDAPTGADAGPG